ncbi:MAG TPA: hypothetical protein VF789_33730 [Thermoanaerobaculia bacterium]
MRTQASRTLFWMIVLGCLLFVPAAMAMQDGDPDDPDGEEETVFTDSEGVDEDGDGVIDPPPAGAVYCVYNIGAILQGNCRQFTTGDRLCINCPANGTCPTPANTIGRFVYVDAFGRVICRGEWARSFNPINPNACIACNNGQVGYTF